MAENQREILTIVGPTATGKTALAATLALRIDGEVISADSRQVYRGMDIGTGKDLADYTIDGRTVPHHLVDIADAGYKYNLYEFQRDFAAVYADIVARQKTPILCGGSGLYVEAAIGGYSLVAVPENAELRKTLVDKSLAELTQILSGYKTLHNTTDVDTPQRAIRAIEIADFVRQHPEMSTENRPMRSLTIGLALDRELRRQRISKRLRKRLDEGMVDEVKRLIDSGIAVEDLTYYGLEYKFVTNYLTGKLTYDEMVRQLEIAIHQFAKRQMTWFRGMERRGHQICWIDATLPMPEKVALCEEMWRKFRGYSL